MNIIVCIKQVPDPESDFIIETPEDGIVLDDGCEYRMNRFDEFAVEAALVLQENGSDHGGRVDLITVGPQRAVEVLHRGIGMGADDGIHVRSIDENSHSPFMAADMMATALREKSYDLVLTGAMSEDRMQAQTGPLLAEYVGIPSITSVISIERTQIPGNLIVEKELEGGVRDVLQIATPALLSVQPGINRPRYPSLSNLLRANRSSPQVIDGVLTGSSEPIQTRQAIFHPRKERAGQMLPGSLQEKAHTLHQILQRKSLVKIT